MAAVAGDARKRTVRIRFDACRTAVRTRGDVGGEVAHEYVGRAVAIAGDRGRAGHERGMVARVVEGRVVAHRRTGLTIVGAQIEDL